MLMNDEKKKTGMIKLICLNPMFVVCTTFSNCFCCGYNFIMIILSLVAKNKLRWAVVKAWVTTGVISGKKPVLRHIGH